jgi:hypothetical protein
MKSAAVGFRVHSGWTSLVAVALEKGRPTILARSRPHLVANFSYTFRQPYHTAATMSLDEAEAFLAGQRSEGRRLAVEAIRRAQHDVAQQGYNITHAALLLASGRPLPELAQILKAHSLIHSADGEFFREVLLHAAKKAKLRPFTLRERDLLATASSSLKRKPPALSKFLGELGKPLGAPWTQDEKFAALAAWLALVPTRLDQHRPKRAS